MPLLKGGQTGAQMDRKAAESGLHVALDGVHPNSVGAEIVPQKFLKAISDPSPG